jgi:hypothetical protein
MPVAPPTPCNCVPFIALGAFQGLGRSKGPAQETIAAMGGRKLLAAALAVSLGGASAFCPAQSALPSSARRTMALSGPVMQAESVKTRRRFLGTVGAGILAAGVARPEVCPNNKASERASSECSRHCLRPAYPRCCRAARDLDKRRPRSAGSTASRGQGGGMVRAAERDGRQVHGPRVGRAQVGQADRRGLDPIRRVPGGAARPPAAAAARERAVAAAR